MVIIYIRAKMTAIFLYYPVYFFIIIKFLNYAENGDNKAYRYNNVYEFFNKLIVKRIVPTRQRKTGGDGKYNHKIKRVGGDMKIKVHKTVNKYS